MATNAMCAEGFIYNPITGKCEQPAYLDGNGNGNGGWGGLTGDPDTSIWGQENNFWDGITGVFESLTGQQAPTQGESNQGIYQDGSYVPPPDSGGMDTSRLMTYAVLGTVAFLVIKEVS